MTRARLSVNVDCVPGNVSLSTAIVTDVSTPATRGKGMAMIGVAFSLGFLFGPMIGAIV